MKDEVSQKAEGSKTKAALDCLLPSLFTSAFRLHPSALLFVAVSGLAPASLDHRSSALLFELHRVNKSG